LQGTANHSGDPELPDLLRQWREDLAAWAIPEHITASVTDSPWVLPAQVFARRADKVSAEPSGPSFERAWAALDPAGSVLDVGSGPGAACLPLLPRATSLTAVDEAGPMLAMLADRAEARGRKVTCVTGRWPDVGPLVAVADVVTCHHVLYNVPDIDAFVAALTTHARRIVVVEVTSVHPLTSLSPLWRMFHGLRRPDRPTGADLIALLRALGLRLGYQEWSRPGGAEYSTFAELVDVTRRRLCLPPDRADELGQALVAAGVDPARPEDLGSSGRQVLTIWWEGEAKG
jgi:SAM-dependent methyltransferase